MESEEKTSALQNLPRRRVAVVGLGALGSELCRLLAASCSVDAVLIDPDRLEERNLSTSGIFRYASNSQFGKNSSRHKTDVLAAYAKQLSCNALWQSVTREIADVNLRLIESCDLIFSCSDSVLARCETSYIARLLGKPLVDGGVKDRDAMAGRISWFPSDRRQACYACQLSEWRRAEVLADALSPSLGCIRPSPETAMDAVELVLATVAAEMFDLGNRALQMPSRHRESSPTTSTAWNILQSASQCARNLPDSHIKWTREEVALQRSRGCPWHDGAADEGLAWVDPSTPLCEVFHRLGVDREQACKIALEFVWPICLRARCTCCGQACAPLRRLAWVRRSGTCEHCGRSGVLEPLEVVQSFLEDSPFAAGTLRQFGFVEDQLLMVRPEYGAHLRGERTELTRDPLCLLH